MVKTMTDWSKGTGDIEVHKVGLLYLSNYKEFSLKQSA